MPADALAPATLRAYAADWRHFCAWCAEAGCAPLPAPPTAVAAYLASLAGLYSRAALDRRLAAIGQQHRLRGLAWAAGDPAIRTTRPVARRGRGAAAAGGGQGRAAAGLPDGAGVAGAGAGCYRPNPPPLWRVPDALAHMRRLLATMPQGAALGVPSCRTGEGQGFAARLQRRAALASTLVAGREGAVALAQDMDFGEIHLALAVRE